MQFGINKHKLIFQRLQKIARARRASAIVVFEKFTSTYVIQIAREKSFDYLLIIYMHKFESDSFLIVFISCHGSMVPPTLTLLVKK